MLNVNLDEETERYLVEILAEEKTTSSELLKRLLREHWLYLESRKLIVEEESANHQPLQEESGEIPTQKPGRKHLAEWLLDTNKGQQ